MVRESSRPFVYGQFAWSEEKPPPIESPLAQLMGRPDNRIAIEILREFSATELIGKMYWKTTGDWTPVDPIRVASQDWYQWNYKNPGQLYYQMEGSGKWKVLHFRNESDKSGPYVAVALNFIAGN